MRNEIYLTDLQSYNEGALVGKWITLPCDNLGEELQSVLATGEQVTKSANHEEYFITDYESEVLNINEHSDIFKLNEQAEELQELDEQDLKKVDYLMKGQGASFEEAMESYILVDVYEDMSFEELAYELVEEGCFGNIPDNALAQYIDYEAIGRDLSFDYTDYEGSLYSNQY